MSQDFPIEIQSSPESSHAKTSFVVVESEEEDILQEWHENITRKRKYELIDMEDDRKVFNNQNSFVSESSCFKSGLQSDIPILGETTTESTLGKEDFDYEDPPIYGFEQREDAPASPSPSSESVINLASEDDASASISSLTEHCPFSIHAFEEVLGHEKWPYGDQKAAATKRDDGITFAPVSNFRVFEKENMNDTTKWMNEKGKENLGCVSPVVNDMPLDKGPCQYGTLLQDQDQFDKHKEPDGEKYKDISIQELCRMVESYGFKPSKSKRALITTLKACEAACEKLKEQGSFKNVSNQVAASFFPSSPSSYDDIVAKSHRAISKAVRDSKDKAIWLKILHYEPISLEEFSLWLRNSGLNLSSAIILSWCDTYGVLVQGSWHSNSS
ncbi:structure-specific endonuclease subunit [Schizosaccharomyces cryophilus OY26]|uniref:Structure-specific endonuclease subunit SLX4 n=1 Tax=Schizosaccharomyces cryophilus (strain OY26 / ATCC MYA-4695 / CBS 11777 / NBRC 106824 / NRRL Y48691) TaxID=653667 RepID=S9X8D6_SCHCR|nr:structure-specific endonuclease subunit [Schizosaccharomyces cryophilus OY26]EPY53367.1 structure-specific endonuclease subunit [Schizosaccharomyces cryophilus OY26]